ncbi:hypothetical protein [Variovorax rhizosphaerae]|uniref:Uncharacterized protein n=1 Tax=Variovorax rhizosphaerae TaxID=1836200 RepID=A0ABU8WQ01_9BURK
MALLGAMVLAVPIAQAGPWTSVGSAGVIDDDAFVFAGASPGVRAVLNGPTLSLSPAVAPQQPVRVRYNVVDVFDRGGFAGPIRLAANFVDNGANAQIVLYLFEQSMASTASRLLLSLNSNAYTPSTGPQVQSVSAGCNFRLDFTRNAYWIEAVLIRTASTGAPALNQLRVIDEVLC